MAFSERRRDAARAKLGRMIRDGRHAADIRTTTLAERLPRHCDPNQIYYWERGTRTPDHDRVEALIRILRLPEAETWDYWREASMRKPKMPRRLQAVTATPQASDEAESWGDAMGTGTPVAAPTPARAAR